MSIGALATALWLSMPASASGHRDVLLTRIGDEVKTGSYDFATGTSEADVRVFARTLDLVQPGAISGNDPGFNAVQTPPPPHEPLPGDVDVTLRAAEAGAADVVLFWDGDGTPEFAALPPQLGVRISMGGALGSIPPMWLPSEAETLPMGLPIATTNERGELHQHVVFSVVDRSDNPADELPPGLYALLLQIHVDELRPSDPVVLVLGHEVDAASLEHAAGCLDSALSSTDGDLNALVGPLPCDPLDTAPPANGESDPVDPQPDSGCSIAKPGGSDRVGLGLVFVLLTVAGRRRRR